jgi:hypothetical protein
MNAGIRRPSKIQNSYLKDSPTWFQPQSDVTFAHSMPFKPFKWKGKGGVILNVPNPAWAPSHDPGSQTGGKTP